MSLTGKTISELPLLTNYNENITIPVQLSGETFQSSLPTLQPSKVWKALLTQTGSYTYTGGTDPYQPNSYPVGGFILNEVYTINDYVAGDDFSNIAEVLYGTINTTDCVFRATGTSTTQYIIPNSWDNSTLTSDGLMIVNVLENTLGYDIYVDSPGFGVDGTIAFFPEPQDTFFLTQKTLISATSAYMWGYGNTFPIVSSIIDREILCGVLWTINAITGQQESNLCLNLPVEIRIYE